MTPIMVLPLLALLHLLHPLHKVWFILAPCLYSSRSFPHFSTIAIWVLACFSSSTKASLLIGLPQNLPVIFNKICNHVLYWLTPLTDSFKALILSRIWPSPTSPGFAHPILSLWILKTSKAKLLTIFWTIVGCCSHFSLSPLPACIISPILSTPAHLLRLSPG